MWCYREAKLNRLQAPKALRSCWHQWVCAKFLIHFNNPTLSTYLSDRKVRWPPVLSCPISHSICETLIMRSLTWIKEKKKIRHRKRNGIRKNKNVITEMWRKPDRSPFDAETCLVHGNLTKQVPPFCAVPTIRGTQRQFSENICSEDDLRPRIFGTFVVKFLACLPLLEFSASKNWYHCPFLTNFYPKKVT